MKAWEAIQSSLIMIEENLSGPITIEELASSSHLSMFYFQRMFSRLVGKPVMEYVKLRRLVNAADYLAQNQAKILDVAMKYGFESHESFTRSFKETYNITPEEYRKCPRPLSHFIMPELSLSYSIVDENVPIFANGIILEVKRAAIDVSRIFSGYTTQNPINDTPGIDFLGELWNKFHANKERISNLLPSGNEAGISFPGEKAGYFSYFAGAEVKDNSLESDFEKYILPSGEYVVCSFEAENFHLLTTDALNKARDYTLGVWLPAHKLEIEPFMAEIYYETTPEATLMEIWLKLR